MRWYSTWNEDDAFERQGLTNFFRSAQMSKMDRIERATEKAIAALVTLVTLAAALRHPRS
jgi:hypothetical protein